MLVTRSHSAIVEFQEGHDRFNPSVVDQYID
jgi:hypothetical protein